MEFAAQPDLNSKFVDGQTAFLTTVLSSIAHDTSASAPLTIVILNIWPRRCNQEKQLTVFAPCHFLMRNWIAYFCKIEVRLIDLGITPNEELTINSSLNAVLAARVG